MSSEPVKIEVDCAVTPYTHHHHHHSHHHIHHATHLVEPEEEDDDEFVDEEDEEDDEQYVISNIKNNRTNPTLSSEVAIGQSHLDESSSEEDRSSNDSGSGSSNSDTIKDQHQQFTCATTVSELIVNVTFDTQKDEAAKSINNFPNGISSPIKSLENLTDNHQDGSKLMDKIKNELHSTREATDDLIENDCEDIVDPVGHQNLTDISINPNNIIYHQETVTNGVAKTFAQLDELTSDCDEDDDEEDDDNDDDDDEDNEGEEDYDNDDEDEDDEEEIDEDEDDDDEADDVSFDGNCDENISANTASSCSPDLLDGERMLEVTRKLVRSTERDPDRDLRKQVLLKTAIRKLPHFMEYNHYSDSFEQNFQLHGNNNNVNCLPSTTQYYEHHISLNHHIDATQPKSYYHSVQPNAIQMSTTSLRMLDLNDDQEAEATIEIESHQLSYNQNNDNNCRTSLEHHHQQHDYRVHQPPIQVGPYERYTSIDSHLHEIRHMNDSHDDNKHDRMIHDLSAYASNSGTTTQTSSIERHATLDNLYQPMSGSDIIHDSEQKERSPDAFQIAHETCNFIREPVDGSVNSDKIPDNLDANRTNQDVTSNDVTNKVSNNLNQDHNAYHLRDHSTTATHAYLNVSDETEMKELVTNSTIDPNNSSENNSARETATTPTIGEHISAGGSDSSLTSSSITSTPDEGVNSIISQSTDATNGHNDCNTSLLHDTSLNSLSDLYTSPYHQLSYDSGVALFSPRSNKRSSSSIGLDDEMEVDHLTDLSTSSQQNSGSGQNINQFKKLRKKEIMD